MVFGFALFAIGYAVFYWGLHHMPQYQDERYSLWCLLGFPNMTPGTPVQIAPKDTGTS